MHVKVQKYNKLFKAPKGSEYLTSLLTMGDKLFLHVGLKLKYSCIYDMWHNKFYGLTKFSLEFLIIWILEFWDLTIERKRENSPKLGNMGL